MKKKNVFQNCGSKWILSECSLPSFPSNKSHIECNMFNSPPSIQCDSASCLSLLAWYYYSELCIVQLFWYRKESRRFVWKRMTLHPIIGFKSYSACPQLVLFCFFFVWRHGKNLSCSIYFSVFAPLKTISLICMSRIAQKLSSAKHFATPVIFVTSCIILCFVPHLTKFHSVCVQFWSRKVLSFVSPARESVRQRVKKVWFDSPKKKPFHSGNLLDWLKNEVMDLKHPNTTNKHTYRHTHTHTTTRFDSR